MGIKYQLPQDPGPKVKALVDHLQAMASNREHGDREIFDTVLGGLITIVADLERDVINLNAESAAAKNKASIEDLQYRSAGGR